MTTLLACIVYLYLGGAFAVLVNKIGWYKIIPQVGDDGTTFFIRLIAWPILFVFIPILLAYEKHKKDSE